jgi:parallel beta-helix repeat protein
MLLRGCDFSIAMLIVFVVSVTGAGIGYGKTIYVDCDATGGPNGSSWPNAYTDIQDALNDPCLAYGDEIWVAEGVYKPTLTRFLLVDGVEMYGGFAGDETSLEERDYEQNKTYLSGDLGGGNQSSRIVLTNNGVGAATILDGFEITGGYRGIYSYQSEEIISNCVISGNSGDGIYCDGSGPAIDSCIIEDNGQDGINPDQSSSVAITSCIIRNNGADGIYYLNAGSSIVANNWIHHNGSNGIKFADSGAASVRNNTIVYNSQKGVYRNQGTAPEISNCILWGNDGDLNNCTATYSCIEDNPGGEGNIATDPNFLYSVSVVYDPNHCDFHLSPVSPCIDMGDPNGDYSGELDIDGEERVIDIADKGDGDVDVDMGADEFSYDLNRDGIIDYRDFAIFGMAWQSEESQDSWNPACDFVGDGLIDIKDLAFFGTRWGFGWTYDIVEGDLTGEGIVDYRDFAIFSMAWQSEEGQDSWNPVCDFVVDGLIDIKDLAFFGTRWGFGWP